MTRGEAPEPGRSMAMTRKDCESAGMFRDHQRADPARPWSRSAGCPVPTSFRTTAGHGVRSRGRDVAGHRQEALRTRRGLEDPDAALRGRVRRDRSSLEEAANDVRELVRVREVDGVRRPVDDCGGDGSGQLDGALGDHPLADQRIARPDHRQHPGSPGPRGAAWSGSAASSQQVDRGHQPVWA